VNHPTHRRSLGLLIAATALWGVSFPLVKGIMQEQATLVPSAGSWFLSSWTMTARFALAALILLPWVWRSGIRPDEWKQGGILAFWCGFGMWFQADGLAHTAASTSAFLTQGYCLFLPLWAAIQHRSFPGVRTLLATIMVLAGGAWLSGLSPGNLRLGRGETETLIAALLFTFQILALENPRYAANRGLPVAMVMFTSIALLFTPITLLTSPSPSAVLMAGGSLDVWGLVLSLTVLSTVGAYGLMIAYQRGVTATEAGLIYCCEPVFTALYVLFLPAWIGRWTGNNYPNEVWTTAMIGGGLLITIANVLMQSGPRPVGEISRACKDASQRREEGFSD
jgi:drug/metabolite transporter (DMT)-like permease